MNVLAEVHTLPCRAGVLRVVPLANREERATRTRTPTGPGQPWPLAFLRVVGYPHCTGFSSWHTQCPLVYP